MEAVAAKPKRKRYDSCTLCYQSFEKRSMWDWDPFHYVEDGERVGRNFVLLEICDRICRKSRVPGEVKFQHVVECIDYQTSKRKRKQPKWHLANQGGW